MQGLADDLAGAKAAFKANWERSLAAGAVQREIAGGGLNAINYLRRWKGNSRVIGR